MKYKELCLLSYHYTDDINEAEDIVQDVFIHLLNKTKLDTVKSIEAYLIVAIKNNSLRAAKKKRNFESLNEHLKHSDSVTTPGQYEDDSAARITLKKNFYKALDSLPTECRNVFLLSGLNGMKYAETAEELGISINTVKSQMKKAYKIMRNSLKQIYLFIALKFTKPVG
ncbi:sigma-70 family RNA polymerase sigma factor [Flavobacteriaceae bacterium F08102]|nr:sigma-70 family RNA polymerase sigma factor [Flavobacteriaceae bacterium F08102]